MYETGSSLANAAADMAHDIRAKYYRQELLIREANTLNQSQNKKRGYLFNYDVYEAALSYTVKAINDLVSDIETTVLGLQVVSMDPVDKISAFLKFFDAAGSGGRWDLKSREEFRRLFIKAERHSGDAVLVSPIKNDFEFLYYYDIWANILYGFMGRTINYYSDVLKVGAIGHDLLMNGFVRTFDNINTNGMLEMVTDVSRLPIDLPANLFEAGINSSNDHVGVDIGSDLFDSGIRYVSNDILHQHIFINRIRWDAGQTKFAPEELVIVSD
jgi:hypothetical protein